MTIWEQFAITLPTEELPLNFVDESRREMLHSDPMVLPNGRTSLFSVTTNASEVRIEAVSIDTGRRTVVADNAKSPRWPPTGHLLFGRDGAVWAVPLDPASATVTGAVVRAIPAGVIGDMRSGSWGFQISTNGMILYAPSDFAAKRVISVGRDGSELTLALPPAQYGNPRISPDGRHLVIETGGSAIDSFDLTRGVLARLLAGRPAFGKAVLED